MINDVGSVGKLFLFLLWASHSGPFFRRDRKTRKLHTSHTTSIHLFILVSFVHLNALTFAYCCPAQSVCNLCRISLDTIVCHTLLREMGFGKFKIIWGNLLGESFPILLHVWWIWVLCWELSWKLEWLFIFQYCDSLTSANWYKFFLNTTSNH